MSYEQASARPRPTGSNGFADPTGLKSSFATTAMVATGATLFAAVGATMLNGGGFAASSQSVFVVLAGVALLAAVSLDSQAVIRAARSPLALSLAALAVVSAASAAWTVDGRAVALRWGLVVGGYAAVYMAASVLARRAGPWPIAATLALLALVEAVPGLDAVARHALPDAERIDGMWRPGGTFQYPPALAILQVGALPVLSGLLARRSRLIAGSAAAATVMAGATLGLAGSRLADAIAVLLLAASIVRPRAERFARMTVMATTAFVAAGAVGGRLLLHAGTGLVNRGVGAPGMAGVAVLAVVAGGLWVLARTYVAGSARRSFAAIAVILMCAGGAVMTLPHAGPAHAVQLARRAGRPAHMVPQREDWIHGRGGEWRAAFETWLDRPLLGAGAGSYYTASVAHQGHAPTRYAHDLPLELAAELGVPGLLLGLALYVSACLVVIRARRSPAVWLVGPLVLIFLASNLLDWTWHLAGLTALWAATCGTLGAAASSPTNSLDSNTCLPTTTRGEDDDP